MEAVLTPLYVGVSNTHPLAEAPYMYVNYHVCGTPTVVAGVKQSVSCGAQQGRYVIVQTTGDTSIGVCDVQVHTPEGQAQPL